MLVGGKAWDVQLSVDGRGGRRTAVQVHKGGSAPSPIGAAHPGDVDNQRLNLGVGGSFATVSFLFFFLFFSVYPIYILGGTRGY